MVIGDGVGFSLTSKPNFHLNNRISHSLAKHIPDINTMKSTIIFALALLGAASGRINSEWGRRSTRKHRSLQLDGNMSFDFSSMTAADMLDAAGDAFDTSMSMASFIPPPILPDELDFSMSMPSPPVYPDVPPCPHFICGYPQTGTTIGVDSEEKYESSTARTVYVSSRLRKALLIVLMASLAAVSACVMQCCNMSKGTKVDESDVGGAV